jgi:hypothetical protein
VAVALDQAADAFAANPFGARVPVCLAGVVIPADGPAVVADRALDALPVGPSTDRWQLLAVSGGGPVDVFGEWDGDTLAVCTVAVDGELVGL